MRYAVIDLETTGFSHREDRVVEMACVIVRDRKIEQQWSTLVNPGRSIPWRVSQIHGITDEVIARADAPSFEFAQRSLWRLCAGATVVAHNARFDLGFLPALAHLPSLCTVALARRCFPNAPNFKNQTLREYLGIELQGDAHRALADALVTANILVRCLERFEAPLSA